MKWIILAIGLIFTHISYGQESTIRILGVYPSHQTLNQSYMTVQLQTISSVWNNTNLATYSGVTVQALNSAVAVPMYYPWALSSASATANLLYEPDQKAALAAIRAVWQADVIVLFINTVDSCGASRSPWYDANGNFVAGGNGLDLRSNKTGYVSVVDPVCHPVISAHEVGHLLGGGHRSIHPGLYQDSRAAMRTVSITLPFGGGTIQVQYGTVMADNIDDGVQVYEYEFSRNFPGHGDVNHNNVRAISTTALSVANYYEYPSAPPVLNPPINLQGFMTGCQYGWTGHDVFWQKHPSNNVEATHYEVWKSQPIGNPNTFGWTVYTTYTPAWVIGADARMRVKACSGFQCSNLSTSFYDVTISPACNNW